MTARSSRPWQPGAGFVWTAIVLAHAALFVWLYGRFGDLIIDTSREATVPWRILEGQVLYRDIHYIHGPLPAYLLAGLYALFGRHLLVLQGAGLASSMAASWLLFSLTSRFIGRRLAAAAPLVFIAVFAFAYYLPKANIFNFILPYSFCATFGVVLLLCLFRAGAGALDEDRARDWALLGACFSLTALTKIEIFAAGAVFVAALAWAGRSAGPSGWARRAGPFLLAAGAVLLPCVLTFGRAVDWAATWRDAVLPETRVLYASWLFGTDRPAANVGAILLAAGGFAALGVLSVWAGRLREDSGPEVSPAEFAGPALALAAASGGVLWLLGPMNVFRCMGLFIVLLAARCVLRFLRGEGDRGDALLLGICAASLALMLRKLLALDPSHFGFYMLVPGLVPFLVFLFGMAPGLTRRPGDARWIKGVFAVFLAAASLALLSVSLRTYRQKTHALRTPRGTLVLEEDRFAAMDALLAHFRGAPRPLPGMLAVPEGALINFLLDSVPTVPTHACLPHQVATPEQEDRYLDSIKSRDIRYVFVVSRRTIEYGKPILGEHYFRRLHDFLLRNFEEEAVFGPPPFSDVRFGVLLLRRKADAPDFR